MTLPTIRPMAFSFPSRTLCDSCGRSLMAERQTSSIEMLEGRDRRFRASMRVDIGSFVFVAMMCRRSVLPEAPDSHDISCCRGEERNILRVMMLFWATSMSSPIVDVDMGFCWKVSPRYARQPRRSCKILSHLSQNVTKTMDILVLTS
jgi:hypothetical protein